MLISVMDPSLNQPMNHNQMNLHPPAHLHAQSHNSHTSQHSQHSNQSNQSQQQQGQGGNGQGVNVDDMFHQETGLDDADDEDDGDGEFLLLVSCLSFSPPFARSRWTWSGGREVSLAFIVSSDTPIRVGGILQTGRASVPRKKDHCPLRPIRVHSHSRPA